MLKILEISRATVRIDVMGCQKENVRTIRGRKADYILALKAAHEHFFEEVVAFWGQADTRLLKGPEIGVTARIGELGHVGRIPDC